MRINLWYIKYIYNIFISHKVFRIADKQYHIHPFFHSSILGEAAARARRRLFTNSKTSAWLSPAKTSIREDRSVKAYDNWSQTQRGLWEKETLMVRKADSTTSSWHNEEYPRYFRRRNNVSVYLDLRRNDWGSSECSINARTYRRWITIPEFDNKINMKLFELQINFYDIREKWDLVTCT